MLIGQFPNAAITLCSVIPRKGNKKHEDISLVNDFLVKSQRRLGINVISLDKIRPNMCYDEKHVNNEGVRILVNAAIFTLTGLFPAVNYGRRNAYRGGRGFRGGGNRYRNDPNKQNSRNMNSDPMDDEEEP